MNLCEIAKDKTDKRLLGFSFTPLMDADGTVLPDGQHQLFVYKTEEAARFRDPSTYLHLPYSAKQSISSLAPFTTPPSGAVFQRNSRESVTIAFYLCSTKLTQNGHYSNLNSNNPCFYIR